MNIIKITELLNSPHLVTQGDGRIVFDAISARLDRGEIFTLDFEGIEIITACCLNVAIGQLYGQWDAEYLNEHIKIKDLHWHHRDVFRVVTDNAKEYFAKKNDKEVLYCPTCGRYELTIYGQCKGCGCYPERCHCDKRI